MTAWLRGSIQPHVLVVHRQVVDAALRRRDPGGHFSGLDHALHQALHVVSVGFTRQPAGHASGVLLAADGPALEIGGNVRPSADRAAEAVARQLQFEVATGALDLHVPALQTDLAVPDVGVAQHFVHGVAHRGRVLDDSAFAVRHFDLEARIGADVVLVLRGLVGTSLDAVGEGRRGVRGDLRSEEIERRAEPEIEIALQEREIHRAPEADRLGAVAAGLLHHLERAPHDPAEAGLADEHVVSFLRQHETAGAGERVERGLGKTLQLELAVAVGEIAEAEERQPVLDRLVECTEDARLVDVAGVAREQFLGLLASVAAEVGVQYVHHRPEMPSFLDVDLEEIAQIVEGRAGVAEPVLLFDRSGLGIALGDDEAAELRAEFARYLLPHRLAEGVPEADGAIGDGIGQKNAPAVVGHFHRAVMRPALRVHADRRSQVHVRVGEVVRPELLPPFEETRLPVLERALQGAVVGEVDVVGNFLGIVDGAHTRSQLNLAFAPLPYTFSAPCSPTALGRTKIQFCQAESLPKMRVSMLSLPEKRRFASMPVRASGERLARSSIAMRTSSSQSRSSGVNVTRPNPEASLASSFSPVRACAAPTGSDSPQKCALMRASRLTIG